MTRETQVLRASRVIRVIRDLWAQLGQPVILGHKDHRVTRETQVLRASRVFREIRDL